jgi:hypothetical protein
LAADVLSGLEIALWDKPRHGGIPKLDDRGRATLIALACANPPVGRTCWTMQLLANELVVRQVVPSISDETVRRELKKNGLKPWLQEHWCIPEVSPSFVASMEDVLDLYPLRERRWDCNVADQETTCSRSVSLCECRAESPPERRFGRGMQWRRQVRDARSPCPAPQFEGAGSTRPSNGNAAPQHTVAHIYARTYTRFRASRNRGPRSDR